MTTLLSLVLTIAIIGFVCYMIMTYIPMPAPFKNILMAIICVVLVLWVLQQFGLVTNLNLRLR